MRQSGVLRKRYPKNYGVAPRWDIWQNQYDAWKHLKRMSRLAGTGYYIPPKWYQHFRMFPPVSANPTEEQTLNPYANSEPTQQLDMQLDAAGAPSARSLAVARAASRPPATATRRSFGPRSPWT